MLCDRVELDNFSQPYHAEFAGVAMAECSCVVVSVYTSSKYGVFSTFLECLEALLDFLTRRYKYVILTGDFNCDPVRHPGDAFQLKNTMSSFNLVGLIEENTRVTHGTASALDNVFTNYELDRLTTTCIDPAISDHMGIHILLNIVNTRARPTFVHKRVVNSAGLSRLRSVISTVDWGSAGLGDLDGDTAMSRFVGTLTDLMDECGVVRVARTVQNIGSSPVMWFTSELKTMRNTLQALKTVANVTQSSSHWNAFRAYKREYRNRVVEVERRLIGFCIVFAK